MKIVRKTKKGHRMECDRYIYERMKGAAFGGDDMGKEEFWNDLFSSKERSLCFCGAPSPEVADIAERLEQGARVLDLGCGVGRSALFLAGKGFDVTAVDFSEKAIGILRSECARRGVRLEAKQLDLCRFKFEQDYHLIIAHGSLHFLSRPAWTRLIREMKEHTNPGGYNIVAVFTDAIPPPEDMAGIVGDLFGEGELFELYRDWETILQRSYIKEDEHPGNIKHRHPINKLVARKPPKGTKITVN